MLEKNGLKRELPKQIMHMDGFTLIKKDIIPWINELADQITEIDKSVKELESNINQIMEKIKNE